jgi:hypothetical protein
MPEIHYDKRMRMEVQGRIRRLRVVGRSSRSPDFWLCEDLESGGVLLLRDDKLRADAAHDDPRRHGSS